jgi:uncharacterized protein YndB with AHSA1/START domain
VTYEFTLTRVFDAAREEVFDAMTDPVGQREWWTDGAGDVDTACDLRVGGKAHVEWTSERGTRCRAEQTFIEVDRPSRVVLSETVHEPDSPVYECVLTITLDERDGKTFYTLHHVGFPTADERDKHERGTMLFISSR